MANSESLAEVTDVVQILRQWEDEHASPMYDPIPTLQRLAEIIETESENYLKMDPDPFDERHPSRRDPDCNFGHILKILFKRDNFMTKLINDYLRDTYYSRAGITDRDVRKLNIATCRLMLDILPGLETSAVVQPDNDGLIHRLFSWSEKSIEPLQSYATGLLAAAMEVQDIATGFREQNSKMVPLMLQRLHKLQEQAQENRQLNVNNRPFAHFSQNRNNFGDKENKAVPGKRKIREKRRDNGVVTSSSVLNNSDDYDENESADETPPPYKKLKNHVDDEFTTPVKLSEQYLQTKMTPPISHSKNYINNSNSQMALDGNQAPSKNLRATPPRCNAVRNLSQSAPTMLLEGNSNSSWAELESYVIGNVQIYPPTLATHQMLILRYLTPMGEYQEFLGHVFEQNALELIFKYINVRETKDSRLAFEALKYLASLLCHKKFSIEFLNMGGLQKLLDVPRPSVAATGVSICLYYLAYCEDAMECVCLLSHDIIVNLVTYALWLLERSHDSGKCHATMFFGCSFPFKVILEEFDAQDGLRKLFNVISTLPILNVEEEPALNDDEECASRQIVRHVAVALKKYMEAHLYLEAEKLQEVDNKKNDGENRHSSHLLPHKPCKFKNEDEIQEKIEVVQKLINPAYTTWYPVEELYRLGGITLLLQIISFVREWNNNIQNYSISSAETVRSCLDVISICSVVPKVVHLLCDRNDIPNSSTTMAINLLLAAAEGEIVPDSHVQRAALRAIVNCVCVPITKSIDANVKLSAKKKSNTHGNEELIQKVWSSVRSNNGIMVLLQLMMVKTPITDADSIRALACRALAGLAHSDKVCQIISKLPMFTDGQIQSLMKNPIHNEKRQEHVMFQKYALELMERVSGKTKPTGSEYEMSLASLHRANVVAQTRIQYDDQQLYQLICQHLMYKGLNKISVDLQKSVNLDSHAVMKSAPNHSLTYGSPGAPGILRTGPFISASPINLYNKNRGNQRDTISRQSNIQNSAPGLSRFTAHSSNNYTPLTNSSTIRMKLFDNLNQNLNTTNQLNQPIKLQINPRKFNQQEKSLCALLNNSQSSSLQQMSCRSLQKQISRDPGGGNCVVIGGGATASNNVTVSGSGGGVPGIITSAIPSTSQLESIVTEYLTNQHALCKNPMVTCPKFNLFEPHKCPDPRPKNSAATNVTVRVTRRSVGLDAGKLDRKYIYSRFCPIKTFRPTDVEGTFTYCIFSPCQQYLMLGTYSGDVKMFNVHSGVEEATYTCHESYVYHMDCNKKGDLLLTSTVWRRPFSALWSIGTFFDMKLPIDNEDYVEFSKLQDKIIGTHNESATIYDVSTGKLLRTLTPSVSNRYTKNHATFSMNDELVLSDGILWDVNSGKEIHKFDKLNQTLNGVFHPNGTQVVSNTEVWDLRTFHLLNTVPALDQMEVIFSPINNIIYAVSLDQESDDESNYVTSFKTLDALDYSNIGTYDVKRGIYSLACNKYDTQIAIVENQGDFDSVQESCVKLYDVGRRRDDEDEAEEDDDEEDMDASDDDGSNSGSDDNNAESGGNADEGGEDNADEPHLNDGEDNEEEDDDDEDDDHDADDNIYEQDNDDDDSLNGNSINESLDSPESLDNLSDIEDFEILFS